MNPLSYDAANDAVYQLTAQVRELEEQHRQAGDLAAAAEADYRRALSRAYARAREAGKAQDEALVMARAEVTRESYERDLQRNTVANLAEQLEDRRGERASLHRLLDWSMAHDARNGGQRANH